MPVSVFGEWTGSAQGDKKDMIFYHLTAFILGFLLDLLLGDPHFLPHPVRWMGFLISELEKILNRKKHLVLRGFFLVMAVLVCTFAMTGAVYILAYMIHPIAGIAVESIMTYQVLALKCLRMESMKVYGKLEEGSLLEASKAVSMIVGRDTEGLDEAGIIRAAVETIAENTSDGVIAPMLYLAIGGPILGFLYKAVNTMDSMIGYKNDRYLYFGRVAAKLDDALNFIPSRISAGLMLIAVSVGGKEYDGRNARYIYKRDKRNHESPNSAQTESVMAGALRVRLAGDAYYFGKLKKKPYIGEGYREIENNDIRRANRLLYLTAGICVIICMAVLSIAGFAGMLWGW